MADANFTTKQYSVPFEEAASVLADTLLYATQDNADPARVKEEIRFVLTPYCADDNALDQMCAIFLQVGGAVQQQTTFIKLAEREVREHNNTDWDNMKFLLNGAKAEHSSFFEQCNLDTSTIIRRLEKIQAMVVCARHTVEAGNTVDGGHAAALLMEADNRIFDLMCNYGLNREEIEEVPEGGAA